MKTIDLHFKTFLVFILTFLVSATNALADRGVFNTAATPANVPINTLITITVTTEVGTTGADLIPGSVTLYETNASGQPVRRLGSMYDDASHGDQVAADTVFTTQFSVNQANPTSVYVRTTAAYRGDRNRYLSPVVPIDAYDPIPEGAVEGTITIIRTSEQTYSDTLAAGVNSDVARQLALRDAVNDPNLSDVALHGEWLSFIYQRVRGIAILVDPNTSTLSNGLSTSVVNALPANLENPGNNKLLIFAPLYSHLNPENLIADHAQSVFTNATSMTFDPKPAIITKDEYASLDVVKQWGDYGTVIIQTYGSLVGGGQPVVGLLTGTPQTSANTTKWKADLSNGRLAVSASNFVVLPSFITGADGVASMKDTFFYLGASGSLQNDTMWSALKAKGAKVAFGWSETVDRDFNTTTFEKLIDPMLSATPLTAQQAYDAIPNKTDPDAGYNATLLMRTATVNWQNFAFVEGGIINGDFETGDWTGWTLGGDYAPRYQIISGAHKHAGNYGAAIGRWDTEYHGYDPGVEPGGYEWVYQDFTVSSNATTLQFYWWMETYDTAVWDWFDAKIQNTSGGDLATIVSRGGKTGYNFGPYWNTSYTTDGGFGGTGWKLEQVDVSAYRGQKIRIWFGLRLDAFGDQTRVYIDDVTMQ